MKRIEKRCTHCGSTDGELLAIYGYDWDSDDDDALSIQRVVGYQCENATDCAHRVVEQGANVAALRQVARDYENLGDLATQARQILSELAELARQQAKTDHLVGLEMGRNGPIGGGVYG